MPYIPEDDRGGYRLLLNKLIYEHPGDLNFVISYAIHMYLENNYGEPCYKAYNDVIGVLECAKLELYRTHVGIYEESKRIENGDI